MDSEVQQSLPINEEYLQYLRNTYGDCTVEATDNIVARADFQKLQQRIEQGKVWSAGVIVGHKALAISRQCAPRLSISYAQSAALGEIDRRPDFEGLGAPFGRPGFPGGARDRKYDRICMKCRAVAVSAPWSIASPDGSRDIIRGLSGRNRLNW